MTLYGTYGNMSILADADDFIILGNTQLEVIQTMVIQACK